MNPIADRCGDLCVSLKEAESLKKAAMDYPSLNLSLRQVCDLELLLNGAFDPLEGYLNRADYKNVLERMRLADGRLWPMPICLDASESLALSLELGQSLALRDGEGFLLAVMRMEEAWEAETGREAEAVFGTADPSRHPGVRYLYERMGPWRLGGKVIGVGLPSHYDFNELRLSPAKTRGLFSERGWARVIGFQTEAHLDCGHREMILRAARQAKAGVLLQPQAGFTQPGDVAHYTRVRSFQKFLGELPEDLAVLGLIPQVSRQAGPREALWQAMTRKNYGCTHFLVAVDQGDPGSNGLSGERFYPLGAAQELVRVHEAETGIEMLPLKRMVYFEDQAAYLPEDEAGPGQGSRPISSAELHRRLLSGQKIPAWLSSPAVVDELRRAYPPRSQQGFTVFMTGLSGAGKSTIANFLAAKFMELRERPVTLLDGDIVRRNLSSELTFTKEHRDLNIRRIGFVAREITKNGGIAICAPIAPYEEVRRFNRERISRHGGYIEVYVSTPLNVCEERDRKGLYAKARAGLIKGVTGIDDPYEPPSAPELTIDASRLTPKEAVFEVLRYLEKEGYLEPATIS
ncbi:MAG: bifunctional sulfate adenylyltransferase/adenylylsulfate kinase [Deltaproteobacteria bacterium]|nr:bifunctional sulfate adenylyltransferase/adenylylsulfate kinase [Deltaproteobacteria bacterium]